MKNPKPLDRFLIRKAIRHLKASDRALSRLIMKHGPCAMPPALDNPFPAMGSSIMSQQIPVRAAGEISSPRRQNFPCGDSLSRP